MQAIVVITTVGTEEQANLLAEELVARRIATCVNILPVHRSVYRWQGKICEDSEFLLAIKSEKGEYEAIEEAIRELHEYDLPEVLCFHVSGGEERFLQWIFDSLDKNVREPESESEEEASS